MALTKVTGELIDIGDLDLSDVGTISLDAIQGDADANTSITFSGSDVITIATGGSGRLTIGDGALSPVTDNQIDLGTASLEFKNAFFDGTVTADAFAGPLTGNVTGNASGTALTVTQAAQSAITSVGTLTALTGGTGDLIWDSPTFVVDSSANKVGIGTASPARPLHVFAAGSDAGVIRIENTGGGNHVAGIELISGHGSWGIYNSDTVGDALEFRDDSAGVTRMMINSAGNVSIGKVFDTLHTDFAGNAYSTANDGILTIGSVTGDHQAVLMLGNQNIGDGSEIGSVTFGSQSSKQATITGGYNAGGNGYLIFGTNSGNTFAERMRLLATGGLCVGSTSGANAGGIIATVGDNYEAFIGTSSGRTNITLDSNESGGAKTFFRTAGSGNYGSGNGDMYILRENEAAYLHFDTSALTVTGDLVDSSDENLKENITDMGATYGLTTIASLRPRKFDWKEEDKGNGVSGFIAQEVQTVLPNDVNGSPHDEGEAGLGLGVNTSGLLAVAVKAIQELKAENDALKARVTTLEG